MRRIDYLLALSSDYNCRRASVGGKALISCDQNIAFTLIDSDHNVQTSDLLFVVGPGGTMDQALRRGLEILIEEHADELLPIRK